MPPDNRWFTIHIHVHVHTIVYAINRKVFVVKIFADSAKTKCMNIVMHIFNTNAVRGRLSKII